MNISKANYSVEINEEKGFLSSLHIGGKEMLAQNSLLPLFQLSFLSFAGDRTIVTTDDFQYISTENEGDAYSLVYENHLFTVTVFVTFTTQIAWRIDVENRSENAIEWVEFPCVVVKNDLKRAGGASEILWGFNEGCIIDDITLREKIGPKYEKPGYPGHGCMGIFPAMVSTQFVAYYDGTHGLYLATHDAEGNIKEIEVLPQGDGIKFQFKHFTGISHGENFSLSYDFVMDTFTGDWHNAAEIYRNWFEANKPKEFVKITDNSRLPDWYKDSPVVVTYPVRGLHDTDVMTPNKLFPYINAMKKIDDIALKTNSKILVLLMHWEGTAPWAPPYVWPPYGGEEALKAYIDNLHEKGHLLGVYCSGIGFTMNSNVVDDYHVEEKFEKENLAQFMCRSEKEELPLSRICTAQRSGYDMCPGMDFTVETIKEEVRKMVEADIDYVQVMDQNHGGTAYYCYSKEHGHPSVPGKWQTDAMKKMYTVLEEYTQGKGKKVLLGCESAAAESYIPYLLFSDNRYILNYGLGRAVPAYAYVYHEYLNNFMGNQVCAELRFDHKKHPENLPLRFAHSFVAGDMLTLVITETGEVVWNWGYRDFSYLPDNERILDFVKRMNAWRTGEEKKYLHNGKMIAPLTISAKKHDIELVGGYVAHYDSILTSRFVAEDGTKGQVLVNYTDEAVEFTVTVDEASVILFDSGESVRAEKDETVTLMLKALGTGMIKTA